MMDRTGKKNNTPLILFVNPWIHDFAAYDFWSKPLGFLILAAMAEKAGLRTAYLNCLDRFHPSVAGNGEKIQRQGRGPYYKTPIPKPEKLGDIRRTYSRYGLPLGVVIEALKAMEKPDLILVTSLMTYWYPGVFETISLIRDVFPDTPMVLGGLYATLCHDHAVKKSGLDASGADMVFHGDADKALFDIIEKHTGFKPDDTPDVRDVSDHPAPALHMDGKIAFAPVRTSLGCPYACVYCASKRIHKHYERRRPDLVFGEMRHWAEQFGVRDFAFYDDALFINAENHAVPILNEVIRYSETTGRKFRFHTPNALHVREITADIARLMFRAGFHTVRLGVETMAFENRNAMDKKVTEDDFNHAVAHLLAAGFKAESVGAYLLAGLPEQTVEGFERSVIAVKKAGITPVPAYYSPIPGTPLFETAVKHSRYDLADDPVFTNNSIFPANDAFADWKVLSRLKELIHSR